MKAAATAPGPGGGFVISDYVRAHGQGRIRGLAYVAGAVTLTESAIGTLIGPVFVDWVQGATQPDLSTAVDALRAFASHTPEARKSSVPLFSPFPCSPFGVRHGASPRFPGMDYTGAIDNKVV